MSPCSSRLRCQSLLAEAQRVRESAKKLKQSRNSFRLYFSGWPGGTSARPFCSPVRQGGDGSTGQNDFLSGPRKIRARCHCGRAYRQRIGKSGVQKEARLRLLLNGSKPAPEAVGRQDRGKTS